MEPKTSSFQLPNSVTVPVTFVTLANGQIVPRHPDELIRRPTPPPARAGVK